MSVVLAPRRPRRRYEEQLQVLVDVEAAHWQAGLPIETHAGYETARRTLCGLPRSRFRSRRGRGQHRPPSCPDCAQAAAEIAEGLAALRDQTLELAEVA